MADTAVAESAGERTGSAIGTDAESTAWPREVVERHPARKGGDG